MTKTADVELKLDECKPLGGGTRLPANERDPVVWRCRLTLSDPC